MFLDLILDRLWRRRSADQAAWVGIQKPPKNGKVVFLEKKLGKQKSICILSWVSSKFQAQGRRHWACFEVNEPKDMC
jgi:hypothetical protein